MDEETLARDSEILTNQEVITACKQVEADCRAEVEKAKWVAHQAKLETLTIKAETLEDILMKQFREAIRR